MVNSETEPLDYPSIADAIAGHGGAATAQHDHRVRRRKATSCYVVVDKRRVPIHIGANGHIAVDGERLANEAAYRQLMGSDGDGEDARGYGAGAAHDIMVAWRNVCRGVPNARRLPRPLRPLAREALVRHNAREFRPAWRDPLAVEARSTAARYFARTDSVGDWAGKECRYRAAARVRALHDTVAPLLGYERPHGEGAIRLECLGGEASATISVNRRRKKYGEKHFYVRTVTITLSVPTRWLYRVYQAGLAVIDGTLIMDIVGPHENGLLVIAARQTARLAILPQFAFLDRGHLTWAFALPPTPPHDIDKDPFAHAAHSPYGSFNAAIATSWVPGLTPAERTYWENSRLRPDYGAGGGGCAPARHQHARPWPTFSDPVARTERGG